MQRRSYFVSVKYEESMRPIAKLLAGSLIAAAALASPPASAGNDFYPSITPRPMGIPTTILTLSIALKLGIDLTPTQDTYLNLGSNVCGDLKVKASSTCEVVADADCLGSCDPMNFAVSAYNECAAGCAAPATLSCKSSCSPGCQALCMSDCDFDPVTVCEDNCSGSCAAVCAEKLASGAVSDQVACEIACGTTCSSSCAEASTNIDSCGVQCGASCTAQCEAQASMDCHVGCQIQAFGELEASCKAGCAATGSLFCDGQYAEDVTNLEQCVDLLESLGVNVEQK